MLSTDSNNLFSGLLYLRHIIVHMRIYCNNTTQYLNGTVIIDDILEAKKNIRNSNHLRDVCHASELDNIHSTDQKRSIALTKGKGSSSWLTVLPIEEHGFSLNKGEFRDALHTPPLWLRHMERSSILRLWLSFLHRSCSDLQERRFSYPETQ